MAWLLDRAARVTMRLKTSLPPSTTGTGAPLRFVLYRMSCTIRGTS